MSTTSFADMTSRHRIRQSGWAGGPLGRVMETRDRAVRRTAASVLMLEGGERLDLSLLERRSFFEQAAPERC